MEGSEVVHLGLTGNEVATYVFGNMELHNVAVTPDEQRLLGVGALMSSPKGLNPRMSKEEKRIVGASPSIYFPLHISEQRPQFTTLGKGRLKSKQLEHLPPSTIDPLVLVEFQFSTTCEVLPYQEMGVWFSSVMKTRLVHPFS